MARAGTNHKGGRPKGSKTAATLEKERVLAGLRQRIMENVDRIFDSQLSIAQGQQFLYKLTKGRTKAEIVDDPEVVRQYLEGQFGGGESINTKTEYYFITTKEPNNFAIDSMLDRAFGKSTQRSEVDATIHLPKPLLDVLYNASNEENSPAQEED